VRLRPGLERLSSLILDKEVELTAGARDDRDRYDRILRYIDIGDTDAGLSLIQQGLAIARYDSRDGYGRHPRQDAYVAADNATEHVCGVTFASATSGSSSGRRGRVRRPAAARRRTHPRPAARGGQEVHQRHLPRAGHHLLRPDHELHPVRQHRRVPGVRRTTPQTLHVGACVSRAVWEQSTSSWRSVPVHVGHLV
jgi:hypothetical protein